jgi:hypothetical protein
MTDNGERRDTESDERDTTESLYHEAQADGVPYDEGLEPFTRDLPKLAYSRS